MNAYTVPMLLLVTPLLCLFNNEKLGGPSTFGGHALSNFETRQRWRLSAATAW